MYISCIYNNTLYIYNNDTIHDLSSIHPASIWKNELQSLLESIEKWLPVKGDKTWVKTRDKILED